MRGSRVSKRVTTKRLQQKKYTYQRHLPALSNTDAQHYGLESIPVSNKIWQQVLGRFKHLNTEFKSSPYEIPNGFGGSLNSKHIG